jgi:uncharacterized coiled-coil protein SlyX
MSEDRFDKIEEVLAHQDQQISDLSEMVSEQWKTIDTLKKQASLMKDKMAALEAAQDSGEGELSVSEIAERDKPPHY